MYTCFRTLLLASLIALGNTARADNLQQIFDLAEANDPQIRAAEAQLKANQQARTIGRAALLPQITASASRDEVETTGDPVLDPETGSVFDVSSDTTTTTYGANLNQVLFDLPSWYSYKSGDSQAEQAEMDYMLAKQNLIIRTAEAYLNVLRAIDGLETVSAEEKASASQLEQTKQRYEVGLIAVTDVHEAQASYDDVVARLLNSEGSLGIAFENLTTLTGQNHKSIAPLSEDYPILNPEPADAESWVALALDKNYSLSSARKARDVSRYNMKSARMAHLPSINLNVNHQENRPEGAAGAFRVLTDSETTSVSISLDVPIFTGGRVTGQRRQAYYQYQQAQESLNNTERTLVQDTRNQHLSVRIGVSTVNARQQAITSSQSAYEATKAGYDVGTRNLVDVLNAERTLFQARRDYLNERYDYIVDMLNLKRSAGILSSEDIAYINRWLDLSGEVARHVVGGVKTASATPVTTADSRDSDSDYQAGSPDLPLDSSPEQMLQQWAQDWSNLNIDAYLDHYAVEFKPRGQMADNWREDRRSRLERLNQVDVLLTDVDVISLSADRATVLLNQAYSSANYSDRSEKEFVLVKEQGRWKILSEKALRILFD